MRNVLITGGAGFIGSHVAERLLQTGYQVRVLDSLEPQVHDTGQTALPAEVREAIDFRRADLRDREQVELAVQKMDAVIHLAAAVGVGQSMYQICRYTSMNVGATAVLSEVLMAKPVECIVTASSMSVYGEGLYRTKDGVLHDNVRRSFHALDKHQWEPETEDGETLVPVATHEDKRPDLASIYALTKFNQEQQTLILGATYGMRAIALRLFNVYGPRQALSNPYTGVLANFASRLLAGNPPMIFEDGMQRRDLVSVYDVAEAFRLALEHGPDQSILNIGSGDDQSVLEIAATLRRVLNADDIPIEISGNYRAGDIRHCFADLGKARALLGFAPAVSFEEGIQDYVRWLNEPGVQAEDRHDVMRGELTARGLTR